MPELPDVETFRRYINSTSLHQTIEQTHVHDDRILKQTTRQKLTQIVKQNQFNQTERHGKFMFAQLNNKHAVVFHFGMTGYFEYFENINNVPNYTKVQFDFDNGYHLAYINKRMLGQVRVISSVNDFIKNQKLGSDALSINEEEFVEHLSKQKGSLKSWLMNQSHIAGIGNVYSDEILFHAGIRPDTKVKSLSPGQMAHLYQTLRKVMETCIDCQAQPEQMPKDYLVPHRTPESPCPKCNTPIQKKTVNGRGCYLCPNCQQ